MATTEERIDKLDERVGSLERQVSTVAAKVDMVITELQQQRVDMRQAQEKHDADMKEMRENIKGALKHIQGLTIASVVGIAAITVATWAFMWTTANNIAPPTPPPQTTQYQSTEQKTN